MPQELRQVIGIALFIVAMVLLWLALRPRKGIQSSEQAETPTAARVRPPAKPKRQPSWGQDGSYERFQQAVSAAKVSPVSFLSDDDDTEDEEANVVDDPDSEVDDDDQVSRPAETYPRNVGGASTTFAIAGSFAVYADPRPPLWSARRVATSFVSPTYSEPFAQRRM